MQPSVVIHFADCRDYDIALPYHPPEAFPELAFLPSQRSAANGIYTGVRRLLHALGYDRARFGAPDWSPLSDLVAPGGKVVIKPNFVRHYNEDPAGDLDAVVTHLSVLRPLIDYAIKAVGPSGQVIVADAPQYDCKIEQLLERNHLPELLDWYRSEVGFAVEWRDLRVEFGTHIHGVQTEKRKLEGDPEGYAAVDLGAASEFRDLGPRRVRLIRGADYDEEVTIRHHDGGRHEYLVAKTVLGADLVINCPKIKTHKKSGVTLSTKNLIGINGDKNWLPHYRAGFTQRGGDEFPRPDAYSRFRRIGGEFARRMLKHGLGGPIFRRIRGLEESIGLGERARNGNWYGNDTIWRTCIDLNKVFYLADAEGRLGAGTTRRCLNLYDGIICGEGDGPMGPRSRSEGLLVASEDGVAADIVVTWMMGFEWRTLPVLSRAIGQLAGGLEISRFDGDPEHLPVIWIEGEAERETSLAQIDLNLAFEAHSAWRGRIEREQREATVCAS